MDQLSIQQLKDEVSMYDEFIEIPVTAQGKEYKVKMYPYFKPEKVRDLVNELADFFRKAKEEKLNIPQIEEEDLVGYFVIKYFTNLKFTSSKKAKKIHEEFKIALNSQLFKLLLQSYPKESMASVHDRIFEVINASAGLENQFKHYQQMIKELPLENKEVFEQFGKEKENAIVQ